MSSSPTFSDYFLKVSLIFIEYFKRYFINRQVVLIWIIEANVWSKDVQCVTSFKIITHVLKVMNLNNLLTPVPHPEDLNMADRVDLHQAVCLHTVHNSFVLMVIHLQGQKYL